MDRLEHILVVIDPTATEQPALAKAAELAERFGALLELFVCDFDQALSGDHFFDSKRLEKSRSSFVHHRKQICESLAGSLSDKGVKIRTDAVWGRPLYEGILRKVADTSPDLVVKDTHHHSVLRRTLLSNTDWQLIRGCASALLLVKPAEWRDKMRIIAAVDPGHSGDKPATLDHKILRTGELLASRFDADLHLFHAYPSLSPAVPIAAAAVVPMATGATPEDYRDSLAQLHRDDVAELTAKHTLPPDRVHVEEGNVIDTLPAFATDLDADLVIMGAVSRSRLHDVFIGGTAEKVLEHLPCDVMVLSPDGFEGS